LTPAFRFGELHLRLRQRGICSLEFSLTLVRLFPLGIELVLELRRPCLRLLKAAAGLFLGGGELRLQRLPVIAQVFQLALQLAIRLFELLLCCTEPRPQFGGLGVGRFQCRDVFRVLGPKGLQFRPCRLQLRPTGSQAFASLLLCFIETGLQLGYARLGLLDRRTSLLAPGSNL
jgi:hypothetical protein